MNFFKKPDPKEEMRSNQREIRKANRDLETDRRALERREKELEAEIKKLAKAGQKEACATLAKQLVQLRNQKGKSVGMSAKLSGVQAQNSHMHSMHTMAKVMDSTANTMKTMNKQMPADKLMKQMKDFQEQSERMGLTEEMMSDSLDAILDEPGDEAEQDAIVAQVLDEIGIEMNSKLAAMPAAPKQQKETLSDQDLDKILAQLRS
ncbi:unnamed protein product, partial [Mesorhabditis belari]|uniref:Charged multivesicular body protein 2b n=1 Tax=Mesorhabditis belari TaxID=2138241 RepID=A0AAF3F3J1_9BILA